MGGKMYLRPSMTGMRGRSTLLELIPLTELEKSWRVSNATLRRWIRSGRLRGVKLGGAWRVPASEVARMEQGEDEDHQAA